MVTLMGVFPPEPTLSVRVSAVDSSLTLKTVTSLLPAFTAKSHLPPWLRESPPWSPRPLPVPRPEVGKLPEKLKEPSAPLPQASTLFPAAELVMMKTAPADDESSFAETAKTSGSVRTKNASVERMIGDFPLLVFIIRGVAFPYLVVFQNQPQIGYRSPDRGGRELQLPAEVLEGLEVRLEPRMKEVRQAVVFA